MAVPQLADQSSSYKKSYEDSTLHWRKQSGSQDHQSTDNDKDDGKDNERTIGSVQLRFSATEYEQPSHRAYVENPFSHPNESQKCSKTTCQDVGKGHDKGQAVGVAVTCISTSWQAMGSRVAYSGASRLDKILLSASALCVIGRPRLLNTAGRY
jgi:hypothetical protein